MSVRMKLPRLRPADIALFIALGLFFAAPVIPRQAATWCPAHNSDLYRKCNDYCLILELVHGTEYVSISMVLLGIGISIPPANPCG